MTAQLPRPAETPSPCRPELPVVDQTPRERSDAARNRARLLDAATALVREHGAQNVTMEAVADAACVGKGTLFRRFGDREGLMLALLEHAEEEYQRGYLFGPPPLGPGAEPLERLDAFGAATIRHLLCSMDLYLAADACASRRYTVPAGVLRVTHVAMLLRQAGAVGDVELVAQTLAGYLDPALIHHLVQQRGLPLERVEAGWRELVVRAVAPLPSPS
ncbi:TetR family transcriptional regulator [Streptomyces sp. 846.5]|nr:TetR/AcrR family transcriptional regulator [Streptomyces sp. 846.5]TDU02265.1 TetR family transcriptional regulator [Streptomyces sp. 846.5]